MRPTMLLLSEGIVIIPTLMDLGDSSSSLMTLKLPLGSLQFHLLRLHGPRRMQVLLNLHSLIERLHSPPTLRSPMTRLVESKVSP